MQAALKLHARVLPGHRIEVIAPEIPENSDVELIIVLPEKTEATPPTATPPSLSMLDIAESVPPGPRPFATWEEYERFLQAEKDSWER